MNTSELAPTIECFDHEIALISMLFRADADAARVRICAWLDKSGFEVNPDWSDHDLIAMIDDDRLRSLGRVLDKALNEPIERRRLIQAINGWLSSQPRLAAFVKAWAKGANVVIDELDALPIDQLRDLALYLNDGDTTALPARPSLFPANDQLLLGSYTDVKELAI